MSDEDVKEQEQVELELPEQESDDAVVVEETSTEEGSDNFEKAESATQKRMRPPNKTYARSRT